MRYCSLLNFLGGLAFWFFHRFPRPLRTYRGFAFRTLSRILCSTACRPATTRSDRTQFAPSYSSPDRPTPAQVSEPASILQHLYVSIMFNINGHEHPPKQMLIMSHFCRFWTLPCPKEPDNYPCFLIFPKLLMGTFLGTHLAARKLVLVIEPQNFAFMCLFSCLSIK